VNQGSGFKVQGSGFKGSRFRVQGSKVPFFALRASQGRQGSRLTTVFAQEGLKKEHRTFVF
jgi:hypothetical protein